MKTTFFLVFIATLFLGYSFASWSKAAAEIRPELSDIRVDNLNTEKNDICISCDSVVHDKYVLGIQYLGVDQKRLPYFYYCQDTVIKQKIYCNTNLDDKFPAGTDVTRLFNLSPGKNYEGAKFALKHMPKPGIHSFKIRIYFADGSYIEKDTEPVRFI